MSSHPSVLQLFSLSVLSFAVPLAAQPAAPSEVGGQVPLAATPAVPSPLSADAEWATLKNLGRPKPQPAPTTNDAAGRAAARAQAIAASLANADLLRDFATNHPDHPAVPEARRREALALLYAAQAGDTTQDARRSALVAAVRADPALPEADRVAVAAFADNLAVERRGDLDHPDRVVAYEQVARALLKEFPTVAEVAESLVGIAKGSTPARAQTIAADVLAVPAASAATRSEAQIILDRHALVGRNLAELSLPVVGPDHPLARTPSGPVILYSWLSASRQTPAFARSIAAAAPPGALVVGVCLDQRDLAPAQALATAEKFPGTQVFDWLGRRGELAEALKLADPFLVYVADSSGVLRSVTARDDLAAALAQLPAR